MRNIFQEGRYMYRSEINIKHSNRSHLYWGIDKATGEVVGIDDVRSRGLNCNCKCAACNGDFIARKGEKNKHHFAHQSNYECVYANEIAIYLFVKMVFASYQTIEAPEIPVKISQQKSDYQRGHHAQKKAANGNHLR